MANLSKFNFALSLSMFVVVFIVLAVSGIVLHPQTTGSQKIQLSPSTDSSSPIGITLGIPLAIIITIAAVTTLKIKRVK